MSDLTLTKNTDANRYEAWDGDALAGFAEYQLTDQLIVFTHTEVDPSYEGKGVGSQVARFALDDVRADGTHDVLPLCPFIKGWIGRHREYVDLVHGAPETKAKDGRMPAEPKGPDGVPRVDSPDAATDPHRPSESDGTDGVRRVDVIVIGGGPTGENVAQYAHDGGLSVLLIEGELLGGECSYYACMPSKALLRPLDVRATSEHLPGLRPAELDVAALLARRDAWVSHYDDTSQLDWATGAGLDVMRGHARLIGEKTVSVSSDGGASTVVEADVALVLATGSVPVVPPMFADLHAWGSRDATGVVEVPDRLVIVGGGVVACEAATWMSALGSSVTMLVRGDALLTDQEPFAGAAVLDALRTAGVDVRLATRITDASRAGAADTGLGRVHGGPVTLTVERDESGSERIVADELLLATGRRPRLDDVGLDAVGVNADDVRAGRLPTWLHAIGDAGGGAPLTHMGKYEARVLGARLAGAHETPPPRDVPVPQVVFTDPQVAAVGSSEAQAREAGHDVVTVAVPFASAAGTALLRDDGVGSAKIVVDRATGCLLGATFVGHEAAELVHAATVAIVGQVPVGVLRHAVPSYPTSSELWLRLLEELPTNLR